MPVNPYDDRKVTLRRRHGNGNLDIVRTSYTRRNASGVETYLPALVAGVGCLSSIKTYLTALCCRGAAV